MADPESATEQSADVEITASSPSDTPAVAESAVPAQTAPPVAVPVQTSPAESSNVKSARPSTTTAAPAAARAAEPAEIARTDKSRESPGPSPFGVAFKAYVQAQYESHQDSADQLRQGGGLYNQDRFVVQRARFEFSKRWDWVSALVEFDANTVNGPSMSLNRAEAGVFYDPRKSGTPVSELTMGLFRVPFGAELQESAGKRWFTERTTGSRALWPSEMDLGGRLHGGLGVFRYAAALVNGEPKGEKSGYQLQDPNSAKDLVLRLGSEVSAHKSLNVTFGISYATGTGFSAGSDATKNLVSWRDANENGNIDTGELIGNPSAVSLASKSFKRWALGSDLTLRFLTPLGETTVLGEVIVASNMDRGLYVADPSLTSTDVHELAWTAGLTQELFGYGVVGFRFDHYDPNTDLVESRGGKLLPKSQSMDTFAPLLGLQLKGRGRLVFQYSAIQDYLGRTSSGVPTDLKNNTWTLRLQANL